MGWGGASRHHFAGCAPVLLARHVALSASAARHASTAPRKGKNKRTLANSRQRTTPTREVGELAVESECDVVMMSPDACANRIDRSVVVERDGHGRQGKRPRMMAGMGVI